MLRACVWEWDRDIRDECVAAGREGVLGGYGSAAWASSVRVVALWVRVCGGDLKMR
jgi:hypothetical protein